MKLPVISAFIILLALPLLACNFTMPGNDHNEYLVVDLTAIAGALGRDEQMVKKLEQAQQSLNAQLMEIGNNLQEQIRLEKEKRGDKPDENQQKELETLTLQANLQLRQTRQLAQQKAEHYRVQLLKAFRAEALTAAQEIATRRNAAAVLVSSSDLLWYAESIDITDEVIGVLRARDQSRSADETASPSSKAELQKLDQLVDSIQSEQSATANKREP